MEGQSILAVVFLIVLLWAIISTVALGVLWLIFRFYLREYEMDAKSMTALSFKTFGAFLIISVLALFVAYKLFVKSGMEKKAAFKTALLWIAIVSLILGLVIALFADI